MARVIKGIISGRLGDVVYSSIDGRQFVKQSPSVYKKSDSENYKQAVFSFGFCGSLVAAINKIKVFSENWSSSKIKCRRNINKLMHVNKHRIAGDDISSVVLVDTENVFNSSVISYTFSLHQLTCRIKILNSPALTTIVSMQGILQLLNPADPEMKKYKFQPFVSRDYNFTSGEEITFTADFSSQDTEFIKNYSVRKLLLNLAFKIIGGSTSGFSENIYLEI